MWSGELTPLQLVAQTMQEISTHFVEKNLRAEFLADLESARRELELGLFLVLRKREVGAEVRTAFGNETFDQAGLAQLHQTLRVLCQDFFSAKISF